MDVAVVVVAAVVIDIIFVVGIIVGLSEAIFVLRTRNNIRNQGEQLSNILLNKPFALTLKFGVIA